MARRGGFPGGMVPGNMNNLMKQAQKLQKQLEEKTREFEETEFEGTAGGGDARHELRSADASRNGACKTGAVCLSIHRGYPYGKLGDGGDDERTPSCTRLYRTR